MNSEKPMEIPATLPLETARGFAITTTKWNPSPINIDNAETIPSFHVYLPQLADAACIQSAISEVSEMMLHCRIEPKEASALFYAMQVASSNLVHKTIKR